MNNMMSRTALGLAAALVLAGCGKPEPEGMPFAESGVEFSVKQLGSCTPEGAYRGQVSWLVPETLTSKVEIQVSRERRQIFARSNERVGSKDTDPWVHAGLEFYLLDREGDTVLAAFEAGPCSGLPAGEAAADQDGSQLSAGS